MSDFDAVLERLVTDQAFAAALAADPAAALAGYRLDPDEIELLHSQVGGEAGGQHAVEVRTNQSSLFGMLSPLVGMAGALPSIADNLPGGTAQQGIPGQAGFGPAEGSSGQGAGLAADGSGPAGGFGPAGGAGAGPAAGQAGFGVAGVDGFGAATGGQAGFGAAGTDGFGAPPGQGGFGAAPAMPGQEGFGPAEGGGPGAGWPAPGAGPAGHIFPGGLQPGGGFGGFGDQVGDALSGEPSRAHAEPVYAVPEGYHAGLDLDGDGSDDEHTLRGRADGGVDILVDRDGDGQVDIIGHDDDADGHVESADYDKDGDGHFERTRYDDDGDGWLDRTVVNEEGDTKADSSVDLASIAKHLRMS